MLIRNRVRPVPNPQAAVIERSLNGHAAAVSGFDDGAMNIKISRTFDRLTCYDQRALSWLMGRPSAELTARVARQISRFGDGPTYALLGFGLWLAAVPGGREFLLLALGTLLLELPVYLTLKNLIRRRRPADALSLSAFIRPSDRFSFPSGHTAAAFVMAGCVLVVYPLFAPLAYLLAAAIGVSRVLLGVHFPSDILAGAVLGSLCVALVWSV